MKKYLITMSFIALSFSSSHILAGDAAAGKAKSAVCASCHGAKGISANPAWPNLAGQKAIYLSKQLKAFKSGSRSDPLMSSMARPLSDSDIENLSAYYSSIK